MKIEEEKRTIIFSSFPDRKIFTEQTLESDEKFFINILDKNGNPQCQAVHTISSLICYLVKDCYID